MTDETTRLREEVERLRATNTRLNRRCSTYEAGLKEKLEDAKRASGSLGRMLANAAAADRAASLRTMADIVRRHYPTAASLKGGA